MLGPEVFRKYFSYPEKKRSGNKSFQTVKKLRQLFCSSAVVRLGMRKYASGHVNMLFMQEGMTREDFKLHEKNR